MKNGSTGAFQAGFRLHGLFWLIVKAFLLDPLLQPLTSLWETQPFFSWPFTVPVFHLGGYSLCLSLASLPPSFRLLLRCHPRCCVVSRSHLPLTRPPPPGNTSPPQLPWSQSSICSGTPRQHFQLPLDICTWTFLHLTLSMSKMQMTQFVLMKCCSSLKVFFHPLTKCCQFLLPGVSPTWLFLSLPCWALI